MNHSQWQLNKHTHICTVDERIFKNHHQTHTHNENETDKNDKFNSKGKKCVKLTLKKNIGGIQNGAKFFKKKWVMIESIFNFRKILFNKRGLRRK